MLVDSVTLRHFGSIGRLSLLVGFLRSTEPPYWTSAVHSEVLAGFDNEACQEVLGCADLGSPMNVAPEDLRDVLYAQVALGGGGPSAVEHLGEAECLVLADRRNCGVVTDDNAAHFMIERQLGPERVHDTVDVLRWCVRHHLIDAWEAKVAADAIRNNGRHLRRVHPSTVTAEYFES